MTQRRSKLEITIDILRITTHTHKPTRIMYAANLSWKPLKKILGKLVNQGLIVEKKSEHRDKRTELEYEITEKGTKVLRQFELLEKVLPGEFP